MRIRTVRPIQLDRAYPFVQNNLVAFGFLDILFGPDDVYERLLEHLDETNSDIVLGLYPAHDCRLMDIVNIGDDGRAKSIILKPPSTALRYAWVCAVWTPVFTEFIHGFLTSELAKDGMTI